MGNFGTFWKSVEIAQFLPNLETANAKAVKGEIGMAMVQKPQSARYSGMPASAIATGLADFVLTPTEMPEQRAGHGTRRPAS